MSGSNVDPPDGEKREAASEIPRFAPPTAKPAPGVPRTSEGMSSVSGEIGKLDDVPRPPKEAPKEEAPAKAEAPAELEEPAKLEEPEDDAPDSEDEPDFRESEDELDQPRPPVPPATGTPAGGDSRGWMFILAIAAAIVLVVVYLTSDKRGTSKPQASRPNKQTVDSPKPAPRPPAAKTRARNPPVHAPREPEPTPFAETGDVETDTQAQSDTETGEEPVEPTPHVDNPRDPSLIPPGTPAENAKAFSKLPVAPSDGPPIGGIGRTGIHIDRIDMAQGRDNTGCDDPTQKFSATGTEFINVCFRVVHPRAPETLRVLWEKDGAVTRRGKVRIPEGQHAYKTRAYLQVRPEYVGSWRVRIVPEGEEEIDLGVAEFIITE